VHRGETLGALALTKPAAEPLTSTERKLAEDLAGQAGLVLRNVGLTEDLLARLHQIDSSRTRIVTAESEERSRIERRIREGARSELESAAAALGDASTALPTDPERAARALEQVGERGTVALESLREVARGIYPPLLADKGLASAVQAQARRAGVPVTVEVHGVGRYPPDVESAVYFCCVEAMQNAAIHAAPSSVRITLRESDAVLRFDVTDDGSGFDPGASGAGIGVTGMRDRVAALDGELRIASAPGVGTTVKGAVPLAVTAHIAATERAVGASV
jgi:signal transduction histidine kinase